MRRDQVGVKAEVVMRKAAEWSALVGALSGLRRRAEAAIEAAADGDAVETALKAALTEVDGLA